MTLGSASLLAFGVYFGLSPRVAKGLYASMLFHPHPYPEGGYGKDAVLGIDAQDVFFQASDGTRLHAWHFRQKDSKHTVLLSHGNTGNISGRPHLIESILKTGASLFAYDYRGYGRSQGRPSVEGVIDDACSAFDYIAREDSGKKLVLYGESLGAAISCQLSVKRKVSGLILQSGFSSLTKISRHHIPLMHVYPAVLFPQPLLDNLAVLKNPHPPLLVVHGHKDTVVPFSHGKELFESAVSKKFFLDFPEAEHSDIPIVAQSRFVAAMHEFMNEISE